MIGYLKGIIIDLKEKTTLVKTDNIGYIININSKIATSLKLEDEIELYTYMAVRESDISLYGFKEQKELDLFKLLIEVKGVGPKTALEFLNSPIDTIKSAIALKNHSVLSSVPGIGKKTAERIIIELSSKITDFDINIGRKHQKIVPEIEDAVEALVNLGYQKHQILKIIKKLPDDVHNAEEIIRYYLSNSN